MNLLWATIQMLLILSHSIKTDITAIAVVVSALFVLERIFRVKSRGSGDGRGGRVRIYTVVFVVEWAT
jgi:hypothetical protein